MKNKISKAKKHIFLRDIFRQWYLEGINKDLNSIEKVKDFLESETRGTRIITIGVSSGGFAAVLFGTLLNAECIFTFSGQFSLKEILEESNRFYNQIVFKYGQNDSVNKYIDLTDLIKSSNTPIFYFISKSEVDKFQLKIAYELGTVYIFLFSNDFHGVPFNLFDLKNVINKTKIELLQLYEIYKGHEINAFYYSIKVSGITETSINILKIGAPLKLLVAFLCRIGVL
jgi:hypothetical protein